MRYLKLSFLLLFFLGGCASTDSVPTPLSDEMTSTLYWINFTHAKCGYDFIDTALTPVSKVNSCRDRWYTLFGTRLTKTYPTADFESVNNRCVVQKEKCDPKHFEQWTSASAHEHLYSVRRTKRVQKFTSHPRIRRPASVADQPLPPDIQ